MGFCRCTGGYFGADCRRSRVWSWTWRPCSDAARNSTHMLCASCLGIYPCVIARMPLPIVLTSLLMSNNNVCRCFLGRSCARLNTCASSSTSCPMSWCRCGANAHADGSWLRLGWTSVCLEHCRLARRLWPLNYTARPRRRACMMSISILPAAPMLLWRWLSSITGKAHHGLGLCVRRG
jgi:hypothetical protein